MTAWKSIFFVIVLAFIADASYTLMINGLGMNNIFVAVAELAYLIPFYGYAWQKSVGTSSIAKGIFFVIALSLLGAILIIITQVLKTPNFAAVVASLVTICVVFVFIYPPYMYAFRSQHIWEKDA